MVRDYDRAFDDLWDVDDEPEHASKFECASESEDSGPKEPDDGADGEDDAYYWGKCGAKTVVRVDHTPYDRKYVPPWDEEYEPDATLFEKLAICINVDQPVLVVGPRGSGKSSAIRALASLAKQPLRRINLTNQTRVRDFIGYRTLDYEEDDGGEARQVINWVDGILPDAVRHNHWILVDELDAAPPGVLFAMQAVLEPERMLVLAENSGEVVRPPAEKGGSRFRIFATANTLGYGDDTGFYAGTNVMNQATLDRFAVIRLGYPDTETEEQILKSRTGLSSTIVKRMIDFATGVRSMVAIDDCGVNVSTRQLIQWGQMIVVIWGAPPSKFIMPIKNDPDDPCQYAITLAYSMTVGGKLTEDDERAHNGVFQREFGFKVFGDDDADE